MLCDSLKNYIIFWHYISRLYNQNLILSLSYKICFLTSLIFLKVWLDLLAYLKIYFMLKKLYMYVVYVIGKYPNTQKKTM